VFVLFVAGAVVLAGQRGSAIPDERRKGRLNLFLLFVVATIFGTCLTQHDLFPFAAWNLLPRWVGPNWTAVRLVGVDAGGVEHAIDVRAWEPLSGDELRTWFQVVFIQLDSAARDSVAGYLLNQAEVARRAAAGGKRIGRYDRFLGPLRAPLTVVHPRLWGIPDSVPPPFLALRYYRDRWSLVRRARHLDAVSRRLVFEYRRR
jgi:hypothetical protein